MISEIIQPVSSEYLSLHTWHTIQSRVFTTETNGDLPIIPSIAFFYLDFIVKQAALGFDRVVASDSGCNVALFFVFA
jgi:hypothetical protein